MNMKVNIVPPLRCVTEALSTAPRAIKEQGVGALDAEGKFWLIVTESLSAKLTDGSAQWNGPVNKRDFTRRASAAAEKAMGVAYQSFGGLRIAELGAIRKIIESEAGNAVETGKRDSETRDRFIEWVSRWIAEGASDIHIEVGPQTAAVSVRIHGQLEHIEDIERSVMTLTLAGMHNAHSEANTRSKDTWSEERIQSCMIEAGIRGVRTRLRYQHTPVEPRGSVSVNMRAVLLDAQSDYKTPEELGYANSHAEAQRQMLAGSAGLFIVCGVTGSGKSTTLMNSALSIVETRPGVKIRSIESPVEFIMPGVAQHSVNRGNGGDVREAFAEAIRTVLRMDPDYILVGEVRDREEAELCTAAALAGHGVLTSLHASSCIDALLRLTEIGVKPTVLAGPKFLSGIIYQKLVPLLCPHCKVPYDNADLAGYDAGFRRRTEALSSNNGTIYLHNPGGCSECNHRGIVGQTLASEYLLPSLAIRRAISAGDLIAAEEAWRALRSKDPADYTGKYAIEHAIAKVRLGVVSPFHVEEKLGLLTAPIVEEALEWGSADINERWALGHTLGVPPALMLKTGSV